MSSREAKQAVKSFSESRAPLEGAETRIPRRPGLYAIYGEADVWNELGLGKPPDERPLYVGKAEDSLLARDIRTHFGDGRTGSSTVRRSFAALHHDALQLRGRPRNPANPSHFSNYGLSPEHDAALTKWMRDRLQLGVWAAPADVILATVEKEIVAFLKPPLNLTHVVTEWSGKVKAARRIMADEARAWRPE